MREQVRDGVQLPPLFTPANEWDGPEPCPECICPSGGRRTDCPFHFPNTFHISHSMTNQR